MNSFTQNASSRETIVEVLRENIRKLGSQDKKGGLGVRTSGCRVLDELLPERGFLAGTCVEWLAEHEASGVGTLALTAARSAAEQGGAIVVVDRRRSFYPPAAAALRIEFKKLIVIRASTVEDELWSLDQALRCSGVAAVWGRIDKLNQRWSRRLQLAAEQGGAIGHLLRPARAATWSSWSYAQFFVRPQPTPLAQSLGSARSMNFSREALALGTRPRGSRRWAVELVRCQGLAPSGTVEVELDEVTGTIREAIHETHSLFVASSMAHPAAHCQSAGA